MDISKLISGGIGRIQKIINKTTQCCAINFCETRDTFERNSESILKKAIEEAKAYCIEAVSKGKTKERSVALDELGHVLYRNEGQERSCALIFDKLKRNSTIIHSHPGEDLIPLSPADIFCFLTTPKIKKIIAVDKHGNSCSMRKPDDFMQEYIFPDRVHKQINQIFQQEWLEHFGYSAEIDEKYIQHFEEALVKKLGLNSIDELYSNFIGIKKPKNPQDALDILKFQCMSNGIAIQSPTEIAFIKCSKQIKKIQDTDEGIEIQKTFNEKIAKRFGLDYQYK